MQSMKTDPSIIYMVPYYKQKFLKMSYHEGQVDYFCKKDIIVLGMMEVRCKLYGKMCGFKYSFCGVPKKGEEQ